MYLKLFAIYVLLYFRSVIADENKTNHLQSHSANVQKVQNSTAVKSAPIMPTNEEVTCLTSLRRDFDYEMCKSMENQLDRNRCALINATIEDICSSSRELVLKNYTKNYTQPISDLCDQDFEMKNATFHAIPSTISFFLDSYKSSQHFNCTKICNNKSINNYYVICRFIFSYYAEPLASANVQSKPSASANVQSKPPASADVQSKLPASVDGQSNLNGYEDTSATVPPNDEGHLAVGKPNKLLRVDYPARKNGENSRDGPSSFTTDDNDGGSPALLYFALVSGICIAFYFMMYNKKKILALVVEGRRKNTKRRPNSAAYRKLDCNLEEAMASSPSTSASNTLLY